MLLLLPYMKYFNDPMDLLCHICFRIVRKWCTVSDPRHSQSRWELCGFPCLCYMSEGGCFWSTLSFKLPMSFECSISSYFKPYSFLFLKKNIGIDGVMVSIVYFSWIHTFRTDRDLLKFSLKHKVVLVEYQV